MQSGNAERVCRALVFALLVSASTPAAGTAATTVAAASSGGRGSDSDRVRARSFPSELREECIACLLKFVLVLGLPNARTALCQALLCPQCPRNGVIGSGQQASSTQKAESWVDRLLHQARAGDWKKFRSAAKTLCRG